MTNASRLTNLFKTLQPYRSFYEQIQDIKSSKQTSQYHCLVRDFFLEEATEDELKSINVNDLIDELI